MRRWGCFLFPLALPGKRGRDSCSSHWGRSFVPRLGGSRPLNRPGPAAGQALSGSAADSVPPRGAVHELDVGVGRPSTVPLATRHHLRFFSSARPPAGGGDEPGSVCLATLPHFRPLSTVREATWRWGMFGTHGERPQGARAESCARVRGGAGPQDGRTRRANAASGRGFALRGADSPRPS